MLDIHDFRIHETVDFTRSTVTQHEYWWNHSFDIVLQTRFGRNYLEKYFEILNFSEAFASLFSMVVTALAMVTSPYKWKKMK
jgi:hypothetical protein